MFIWPQFQDHRFSDEIDKLTGYKTQSILCMAICNSDGEVIGVVQAINKNPIGTPFTEDDEKVRLCWREENHSPVVPAGYTFIYITPYSSSSVLLIVPLGAFKEGVKLNWSIVYPITQQ